MGGRDHAYECDVCGMDRGGMNDLPCLCDDARRRALAEPIDINRFTLAPCYLCGYNGEGYYSPLHPCATRYHREERLQYEATLIPSSDWKARAIAAEAERDDLREIITRADHTSAVKMSANWQMCEAENDALESRLAEAVALLREARDELAEAWGYSDYFREKWASDLPTRIAALIARPEYGGES